MKENKTTHNYHSIGGENVYIKNDRDFMLYREKWNNWPKYFYLGDFPLFIDIEVTNACNLKCPFCATTVMGDKIKKGLISVENVKKIIDEGADNGLCGVKFNVRGEPLLHPSLAIFVDYAKSKKLEDVYFNTNAMLLTENISRKMIDAGLDRISISFEGYTKEIYEKYRVGSNYTQVIDNIERLQTLKIKLNVKHPKIRIQTVRLPESDIDLEEYKKFWISRVDEVGFLDYKNMQNKEKGIQSNWACPQLWQRMAIMWDGTILPCNHDDELLLKLGNVENNSIKECWNSEISNKLREIHKQRLSHTIPACDGCFLRNSEIGKEK